MKLLLDENIDIRLCRELSEFDIFTVSQMGWHSKKNGELISSAVENGFTHIISLDKSIQFQQNLNKYKMNFIFINSYNSKLDTLLNFVPGIKKVLNDNPDEKISVISI
jgi:predicted nuclease of predicted toxin-antitoxin system